ncbi:syntaxin-16 [Nilaparvata lugens]|uniref:syntaxin-16 n=1 Tax=Nilaparvata lugens TaxID=108931 RepID=UPI00193E15DE|nr:syntaxin-16 [Nilaparvata lugens]
MPVYFREQEENILKKELREKLMFGTTHKLVQQIRQQSSIGDGDNVTEIERQLSKNVTTSLVASLQELSITFRRLQNSYLKRLNMREERSKPFFDTALDIDLNSDSTIVDLNNWGSGGFNLTSEAENLDRQFSYKSMLAGGADQAQAQLLMLEEENTRLAAHHETEVQGIVKSILDLNDIFKDLAHMVVEQGTVLDRIDYNIEQTQTQVHQGYQQLRKADEYHRKNRKMVCIIVLASVTMFLTFLLIIVKT